MLVMHVLKRSAGIGAGGGKTDALLSERVDELAEAFMVVITATGFLEVGLEYLSSSCVYADQIGLTR